MSAKQPCETCKKPKEINLEIGQYTKEEFTSDILKITTLKKDLEN